MQTLILLHCIHLLYIQFCLLVYSLPEQQIKLVLTTYILEQVKGYDSLIKVGTVYKSTGSYWALNLLSGQFCVAIRFLEVDFAWLLGL